MIRLVSLSRNSEAILVTDDEELEEPEEDELMLEADPETAFLMLSVELGGTLLVVEETIFDISKK